MKITIKKLRSLIKEVADMSRLHDEPPFVLPLFKKYVRNHPGTSLTSEGGGDAAEEWVYSQADTNAAWEQLMASAVSEESGYRTLWWDKVTGQVLYQPESSDYRPISMRELAVLASEQNGQSDSFFENKRYRR